MTQTIREKKKKTKSGSSLDSIISLVPGYDPFATAGDCWFDYDAAKMAIDFFHEHLRFIEGEMAGFPFLLQPWQQCIIANLFGWKCSKEKTEQRIDYLLGRLEATKEVWPKDLYQQITGTINARKKEAIEKCLRRYKTAFIFVARKNGKTPLIAGLIDYVGFCDNEPGAQIYSAAGDKDQASLLYRHSSEMILANESLKSRSRIYRTYKSIEFYGGKGYYKALSADAHTKHGQNTHCVAVDELHVQKNRDLVDTLETSTASRLQPLIIHITTAGHDKETICYEKYIRACQVRDGILEDESFFPYICEAGKDDDWSSEETWKKANPNLGVSVSLDYLRSRCKEAKENPAYENTFKRLHLNMWTEQETRWITMDNWDRCKSVYAEDDLLGLECFGGLDLSSKTDLTAFALAFRFESKLRLLVYFWMPEEKAALREKRDGVQYLTWARQGYITLTPGNTVDYGFIRKQIIDLSQKYKITDIRFDPWNAQQFCTELHDDDGFMMIEFRQGYKSYNEPCKEFERLMIAGDLEHNNNPVLNWMASNISVKIDQNQNVCPVKPDDKGKTKTDGLIASLMATAGFMFSNSSESVYETRGMVFL